MTSINSSALCRTQIYLSTTQQAALAAMARVQGASASALIRDAIDAYIERNQAASKAARRMAAAGQWAANADAPSLRELRGEERSF
jgi:predicted transcriptional regulator